MGDGFSGRNEAPTEEERFETERKSLIDQLEYLEERVQRAEEMGVDFTEVENMLAGARMMVEAGDLTDAAELIGQCIEVAGKRFSEHEMLVQNIRKAETEIQAARESGRDISEPCKHLKVAREYMERGDYRLGLEFAKRALDELTHKKPAEVVWGSGLQADDG